MTNNEFRDDNTEGYTAENLAELNRRFAGRSAGITDPDELKTLAENILRDFDTEHSDELAAS